MLNSFHGNSDRSALFRTTQMSVVFVLCRFATDNVGLYDEPLTNDAIVFIWNFCTTIYHVSQSAIAAFNPHKNIYDYPNIFLHIKVENSNLMCNASIER